MLVMIYILLIPPILLLLFKLIVWILFDIEYYKDVDKYGNPILKRRYVKR